MKRRCGAGVLTFFLMFAGSARAASLQELSRFPRAHEVRRGQRPGHAGLLPSARRAEIRGRHRQAAQPLPEPPPDLRPLEPVHDVRAAPLLSGLNVGILRAMKTAASIIASIICC